jgi:hypothetical protein
VTTRNAKQCHVCSGAGVVGESTTGTGKSYGSLLAGIGSRIVQNRDVDSEMNVEANIAAMPWEDFEHLVRQLFEWEFGGKGVE